MKFYNIVSYWIKKYLQNDKYCTREKCDEEQGVKWCLRKFGIFLGIKDLRNEVEIQMCCDVIGDREIHEERESQKGCANEEQK